MCYARGCTQTCCSLLSEWVCRENLLISDLVYFKYDFKKSNENVCKFLNYMFLNEIRCHSFVTNSTKFFTTYEVMQYFCIWCSQDICFKKNPMCKSLFFKFLWKIQKIFLFAKVGFETELKCLTFISQWNLWQMKIFWLVNSKT